ncbi:hypothetical protein XA68_13813 [Ophiocordyceps unilateralis]|uniref:Mitochondrial distribution and morphology protein 31 n=1 Tax=Ophiocordyceps unilateralis TaxID=268505 RepID=A0A2A9PVJ1_OPHUN|nr:hypothetical protein XA68_13813 [Ophiocordyceps unilateralis]
MSKALSWLVGIRRSVACQPPRTLDGLQYGTAFLLSRQAPSKIFLILRALSHEGARCRPSNAPERFIHGPPGLPRNHGGHTDISSSTWNSQYRLYSGELRRPSRKFVSSSDQPRGSSPLRTKLQGDGKPSDSLDGDPGSIASSVSKYLHLSKIPHRPTKEELLAAANGFWERVRVRFKWMSIRSMRPWNADEWGAFVSWFMLGHLVWILVGTTTFFSIIIFSINTVFAQETLARWVGDYLTQSAGVTIVFESAIVPKWRNGVIAFRNVYVSRRPGQIESSVSKGSSGAAAVAAAQLAAAPGAVDDGNYTQFDVTIANVNVTLSFLNWWNGKGLLRDVEVTGVRGVVDRTSVRWPQEQISHLSYRHRHEPGDFEIETFKLEDLLLTIHHPDGFRPFSVSIYSCELPQLRKQWLFYDFLSASHMSGSFDGSLFTIHPQQVHGIASGHSKRAIAGTGETNTWKKCSRLRIDGLRIDHLNRGVDGPFGWIYEGNVDIVADVMFPADTDEGIAKVMTDFYDQLEEVVIFNRAQLLQNSAEARPAALASGLGPKASERTATDWKAEEERSGSGSGNDTGLRFLVMDLRIHLNDVKAAVPLFTRDISYVNQALVRPIVAYINAKKTYIPITCRIVKQLGDFDGSWTAFDCGLMSDASAETYEAFARDVEDQQSRVRRFKKVGFWTLSLAVHALFMGMAGNVV